MVAGTKPRPEIIDSAHGAAPQFLDRAGQGGRASIRGRVVPWPAGREAAIRAGGCGCVGRHRPGPHGCGRCRDVRSAVPGGVGGIRARGLA